MSSLLNDLGRILAELRSDKAPTRNKAIEQLDQKLTASKHDLLVLLQDQRRHGELSWTEVFECAVQATLKHASKLDQSDKKSYQTLLNKNYFYTGVVNKLIEINLEAADRLIDKSTIVNAFTEGLNVIYGVKYFGLLFINLLDRGIYKSTHFVRELKVNEFSRIINHLFELNVGNDDLLRFHVLKSITRTIELANDYVQIQNDLVCYIPEIYIYAEKATDDRRKAEVIRLYYNLVSQLSIDYHIVICADVQKMLPIICDFYECSVKNETKKIFFDAIYVSLYTIYPDIQIGNFNVFNVPLNENWMKTIKKLSTIVDMEVRDYKSSSYRATQSAKDKCLEHFVKMAALVTYIIHWNIESQTNKSDEDEIDQRCKISKPSEKLEIIISLVQSQENTFDEIWLAIFTELITKYDAVINASNLQYSLQLLYNILRIFGKASNLQNIRKCLSTILKHEKRLVSSKCISKHFLNEFWSKLSDFLISELSENADIIAEKQLIFQTMIKYNKFTQNNCATLLSNIMSTEVFKRNECIATLRQMLLHAEQCGLNKTSPKIANIITWAYDKTTTKHVVLNIDPIDANIIADTLAIAVINFLNEVNEVQVQQCTDVEDSVTANRLKLLMYKHNRLLVCLEKHDKEITQLANVNRSVHIPLRKRNCLFQTSYELLMRTLNYETTKDTKCENIQTDLTSLHKLICMMERFLYYGVFDSEDYTQCPLIKRIGFFLSHLEFQLKSNSPRNINVTDIHEILQKLQWILTLFTKDTVLLQHLEKQPLEELIAFVGSTLTFSSTQLSSSEFEDTSKIPSMCLHILTVLCASSSHSTDSFTHIRKYNFDISKNANEILQLISLLCSFKNVQGHIAVWFVDKLKTIFKLFHTNIEIITKTVEMLPAIFNYVQQFEDLLSDMFIALYSLLKIANKKSYPTHLTVKIIESVYLLTKNCHNLYTDEDFANICLSVAKFINFPSLEIQYATISTITAVMNGDWLSITIEDNRELHKEFCDKLYEIIDFQSLSKSTDDLKQNSVSVTCQMLVSQFVFSSYHRDIALRELAHFCALHKLTAANFLAFKHGVAYYQNRNLVELTKPFVDSLIIMWTEKKYPITKFPYFLCCNTIDDFMQENFSKIAACLFLYGEPDDLKKLKKRGTNQEEINNAALPIIRAFILAEQGNCSEALAADYQRFISNLKKNLKYFNIDLKQLDARVAYNSETLYNTLKFLKDDTDQRELFSFAIFNENSKWFHLSRTSLLKCLHCYVNKNVPINSNNHVARTQLFTDLIAKHPFCLIEVLNYSKAKCFDCVFTDEKLKHFYLFCVFADMILDSIPLDENSTTQNSCKYFIREVIFFTLNFLQSTKLCELEKAAIIFLRLVLNKDAFNTVFFCDIGTYLNDICKPLVACSENSNSNEVKQLAVDTISSLILENQEQLSAAIVLLDAFPSTERYERLREIQCSIQSSEGDKDLEATIKSFLYMKNRGVEGLRALRQYIKTNKSELQQSNVLLLELLKRLMEIVRSSNQAEFSLEALKCLGEIGPLKMGHISYYFQTDLAIAEESISVDDPMSKFLIDMFKTLEKQLLVFNSKTQKVLTEVAQLVVNSKCGEKLLGTFANFVVFRTELDAKSNFLNTFASVKHIDWLAALKSSEKYEYEHWISAFMSKIFELCGWRAFQTFAANDSSFADACLQPFIKLLLGSPGNHLEDLSPMLDHFFEEFTKITNTNTSRNENVIYGEKRAICKFLNICESVRVSNEWSIPINLLNVAKASNYCQAYFLTIIYLELWASTAGLENNEILADKDFQECAIKAYKSVGCTDDIAGFLNPLQSRLSYYNLENNWSDYLLEATVNEMNAQQTYSSILKRNGMLSLASLTQTQVQNAESSHIDYEICWRLGQWDLPVDGHSKVNSLNDMEHEFEKHNFLALKCIFNREESNSLAAISNARECIYNILSEISIECLQSVYKYLTWLSVLQQAEDFCKIQFQSASNVVEIFDKWQSNLNLKYGNFQSKEYILAHHVALFKSAGVRAERKISEYYKVNPIGNYLLESIKECKNAGEMNLAHSKIVALRETTTIQAPAMISALLEDADICFKTGKPQITKAILQNILKNMDLRYCLRRVTALRLQGEYLINSNAESFETVLQKHFNGSLELLEKFKSLQDNVKETCPDVLWDSFDEFEQTNRKCAYESIAKYADREYVQLNTYMNSHEFKMRVKIIENNRKAAESVNRQNADRDKTIGVICMKKYAKLDEDELQLIERKRTDNLCIATNSYIQYCKLDESFSSPSIYRILGLWFANKNNEPLHQKMVESISTVPSYKFICALNQLTARLTSKNKEFLNVLKNLLVACVQDHPHQALYQLYSLVFAFNDGGSISTTNNRVEIAKEIIAKARTSSNANCSKQLEMLFPAMIDFANTDTKGAVTIALSDKLRRFKNFDAIQCPTIDLRVCPNLQYNITSIVKWEPQCSMVGGINAPKKLMCLCSDGKTRPQLLKGKDDLRQDAVMQQVYSMINDLLRNEQETAERKLLLRTYKIVPLSMRSGILEWCENTIPIGMYLIGDGTGGAHKKYRPKDYSNKQCRNLSMQHRESCKEKRYEIYKHICARLKPVFQYFLLEKFLVAGTWFERRLAYTNSIATNSMVGFILGLGDRHTQNILIDEKTAEVIHIDFGIAFEEGRIKTTPETVPFRLTRDIVAPMGVCGTNGVFKKSSESTIRVLRRHQTVITTILEVLLYDPLYIWKIVPQEESVEGDANEGKNLTAQRALFVVQNKLEGKEAGILGSSDIDIQVQRLINEAISPRNLCLLYPGWDPYL